MLSQIAQSAACIQRDPVEQRCARWLLTAHDPVGADHFLLTQEFLGQMLDVRRPTVSAAARHLRDAGAIRYSRRRITVTSRARLEQESSACDRMVEQDYTRAFASL
jgi:CRP-like cAMP-binding protein